MDLADKLFDDGKYGNARCEYYECLEKTKQYSPTNNQKIKYLEDQIKKCIEKQ